MSRVDADAAEALARDAALKKQRDDGIERDKPIVDGIVLEAARRIDEKGCFHGYKDGWTTILVDDVKLRIHHDYKRGDSVVVSTFGQSGLNWHGPTKEAEAVFLKAFAEWQERDRSGQLKEAALKMQPPKPPLPDRLDRILAWIDRRFPAKAKARQAGSVANLGAATPTPSIEQAKNPNPQTERGTE